MTPDGSFAGAPGDFRAQAKQAFENLKLALEHAGANFSHVVKITVFFTDISNLQTFFEVRNSYVNTDAPPASTAVKSPSSHGRRLCSRSKPSPSCRRADRN